MRKILTFTAVMAMAALAWGSGPDTTPAQKKTVAKKAPVTAPAAKKPVVAGRKPATSASAAKRAPVKKGPVTTWRNRQTSPSADRYKEIQDALVAGGYLSSEEATGNWGQASADALKKFQAEQTLETSGKINSLSLIALGLGPKHDMSTPRIVDGNFYPQPESGRN